MSELEHLSFVQVDMQDYLHFKLSVEAQSVTEDKFLIFEHYSEDFDKGHLSMMLH